MSRSITNFVTLQPTAGNTTAAYAAGQQIGSAILTMTGAVAENGGTGYVASVAVICNLMTAPALSLWFFKADPSLTTTDRQTVGASDVNMANNFLGKYDITTTDYVVGANNTLAFADRTKVPIQAATGTTHVYCIPVANAAMSLTGQDLTFRLGIMAD